MESKDRMRCIQGVEDEGRWDIIGVVDARCPMLGAVKKLLLYGTGLVRYGPCRLVDVSWEMGGCLRFRSRALRGDGAFSCVVRRASAGAHEGLLYDR